MRPHLFAMYAGTLDPNVHVAPPHGCRFSLSCLCSSSRRDGADVKVDAQKTCGACRCRHAAPQCCLITGTNLHI